MRNLENLERGLNLASLEDRIATHAEAELDQRPVSAAMRLAALGDMDFRSTVEQTFLRKLQERI